MERTLKALANHKNGYNCAQAVVCTYCDEFGIDERVAFRIAEGYGLGMGCMDTCGAVTAMAMVTGMKESDGNIDSPKTKKTCYKKAKEMIDKFKDKNGSIICRDLKGTETGAPMRSCDGCIEDAVRIIESSLFCEND